MSADDLYPSFLSVFIDCVGIKQGYSDNEITNLIKVIILYIHSYALLHRQNQICVVCSKETGSGFDFIFPPKESAGNFLPTTINQLLTILNDNLTLELFSSSTTVATGGPTQVSKVVSLTNPISRILCCKYVCFTMLLLQSHWYNYVYKHCIHLSLRSCLCCNVVAVAHCCTCCRYQQTVKCKCQTATADSGHPASVGQSKRVQQCDELSL